MALLTISIPFKSDLLSSDLNWSSRATLADRIVNDCLSCSHCSSSMFSLQHVRNMNFERISNLVPPALALSKTTPSSVSRIDDARNTHVTMRTVDATDMDTAGDNVPSLLLDASPI